MNVWTGKPTTKFERWWDKEDMDSDGFADFTSCEVVWKAARAELLKEQRQRKRAKAKVKR